MSKNYDCIYRNGKIFTADPSLPEADAMAVKDGKIAWIGKEKDLDGQASDTVDLEGKRVLPGFIDGHIHPIMLADTINQIACVPPQTHSIKELQEQIRQKRKEQGPDQWILAWGYDEGKLTEGRAPNRKDLDEACSDAPIMVIRTCFHIYSVNSKVLELAGIDRNTPDPAGGQIDRDEQGEPTGIVREAAKDLIDAVKPVKEIKDSSGDMVKLSDKLLAHGITAITECYGEIHPVDYYDVYCQARKEGMKQRVAIYYVWDQVEAAKDLPKERRNVADPIHIGGVKVITDGSVSGRTAWCDKPYVGTVDEFGLPVTGRDDLIKAGELAKKYGLQLVCHAMGERAIDLVVDQFWDKEGWLGDQPSVRVEHVAMPTPEAIKKAAKGGIAFVSQPIFLYAEIESYLKNIGPERTAKTYPYRTFLEEGVTLSFSSDAPATAWADPVDPFAAIQSAVTRKAYDGTDTGQDQRVDVKTALELYTRESQRIVGIPQIGRLSPGYFADFMVLDQDILSVAPEKISEVGVEQTYMSGKLEYQR